MSATSSSSESNAPPRRRSGEYHIRIFAAHTIRSWVHFARLQSFVRKKSSNVDKCFVVLTGGFLGGSCLSLLDRGAAGVQMLTAGQQGASGEDGSPGGSPSAGASSSPGKGFTPLHADAGFGGGSSTAGGAGVLDPAQLTSDARPAVPPLGPGVDFLCLGPQEFEHGTRNLERNLKALKRKSPHARPVIINSNVMVGDGGVHTSALNALPKYHIEELDNGFRLGFLGLCTPDARVMAAQQSAATAAELAGPNAGATGPGVRPAPPPEPPMLKTLSPERLFGRVAGLGDEEDVEEPLSPKAALQKPRTSGARSISGIKKEGGGAEDGTSTSAAAVDPLLFHPTDEAANAVIGQSLKKKFAVDAVIALTAQL